MKPLAFTLLATSWALMSCQHPFGRDCSAPDIDCGDESHCAVVQTNEGAEYEMCLACLHPVDLQQVPKPEPHGVVGGETDGPIELQCGGLEHFPEGDDRRRLSDIILIETSLRDFIAPSVQEVTGNIVIVGNEVLTQIEMPDLRRVGGRIVIAHNGKLTMIDTRKLTDAPGILMDDNGPAGTCEDLLAPPDAGSMLCVPDTGCSCGDPALIEQMFNGGDEGFGPSPPD